MNKKFILLIFLLSFSPLSGLVSTDFNFFYYLSGYDDYEEVEEEAEEVEEAEAGSENIENEEEIEEVEEDPFAKKPQPVKDDFTEDPFKENKAKKDTSISIEEDDFVEEKREKGKTHKYKEPDIGKISVPTYLYLENSVSSKKLFELYRNDEIVILEEKDGFTKVEFLGKQGWVPKEDIKIEKWHTYRVSLELSGGVAAGAGEIKNFDVIGNYIFRLNVAVVQDFVIGVEGRGLSFDTDVIYAGGGLMLRYYIHGLRSKKTRSAISAYAGYIGGYEKPSESYGIELGETQYKVFAGPYVGGSLDYYFRIWDNIAVGLGGDFTFVKLYGETENHKLEKEFYQGGGHLSFVFNILR